MKLSEMTLEKFDKILHKEKSKLDPKFINFIESFELVYDIKPYFHLNYKGYDVYALEIPFPSNTSLNKKLELIYEQHDYIIYEEKNFYLFALKDKNSYLLGSCYLAEESYKNFTTEGIRTVTNNKLCKALEDIKFPCGYCTLLITLATKYTNILYNNCVTTMMLSPNPYIAGVTCYYKSKIYNDMLVFYPEKEKSENSFETILRGDKIFLEKSKNLNEIKRYYFCIKREFLETYLEERDKILKNKFFNLDKTIPMVSDKFKVEDRTYTIKTQKFNNKVIKITKEKDLIFFEKDHLVIKTNKECRQLYEDALSIMIHIGVPMFYLNPEMQDVSVNTKKYVRYERNKGEHLIINLYDLLVPKEVNFCNMDSYLEKITNSLTVVYVRKDISDAQDFELAKNKLYKLLYYYTQFTWY